MPHYRDGAEAQVGDYVKGEDWQGKPLVGRVESITPGSTTCNMVIAVLAPSVVAVNYTETVGKFDLLHRDGAASTPE